MEVGSSFRRRSGRHNRENENESDASSVPASSVSLALGNGSEAPTSPAASIAPSVYFLWGYRVLCYMRFVFSYFIIYLAFEVLYTYKKNTLAI